MGILSSSSESSVRGVSGGGEVVHPVTLVELGSLLLLTLEALKKGVEISKEILKAGNRHKANQVKRYVGIDKQELVAEDGVSRREPCPTPNHHPSRWSR